MVRPHNREPALADPFSAYYVVCSHYQRLGIVCAAPKKQKTKRQQQENEQPEVIHNSSFHLRWCQGPKQIVRSFLIESLLLANSGWASLAAAAFKIACPSQSINLRPATRYIARKGARYMSCNRLASGKRWQSREARAMLQPPARMCSGRNDLERHQLAPLLRINGRAQRVCQIGRAGLLPTQQVLEQSCHGQHRGPINAHSR